MSWWNPKMKAKYTLARFAVERPVWNKFKVHCMEKEINSEDAVRTLVIRYLKHNKIIDDSVPDVWPKEFLKMIKEDRHQYHIQTSARAYGRLKEQQERGKG